jgi:hypothetical protein
MYREGIYNIPGMGHFGTKNVTVDITYHPPPLLLCYFIETSSKVWWQYQWSKMPMDTPSAPIKSSSVSSLDIRSQSYKFTLVALSYIYNRYLWIHQRLIHEKMQWGGGGVWVLTLICCFLYIFCRKQKYAKCKPQYVFRTWYATVYKLYSFSDSLCPALSVLGPPPLPLAVAEMDRPPPLLGNLSVSRSLYRTVRPSGAIPTTPCPSRRLPRRRPFHHYRYSTVLQWFILFLILLWCNRCNW